MNEKERFMTKAVKQALVAMKQDEVPIGAVIVKDGKVITRAHNRRRKSNDATAHAETEAIRKACKKIGDWRLNGCEMYVTLEPCLMCLGACYNARISKVYFGAYDKTEGRSEMMRSVNTLNHNLETEGGVLEEKCSNILTQYFKSKRSARNLPADDCD